MCSEDASLKWSTEQGYGEMQLLTPSQVLPHDWTLLMKQAVDNIMRRIRMAVPKWESSQKMKCKWKKRTSLKEREQCETVVRRYFGAVLRRKQPICQSGFLHECNLRGQGSGKILTDTRTLMFPRPLKQMTQILSESRHLADRALQM